MGKKKLGASGGGPERGPGGGGEGGGGVGSLRSLEKGRRKGPFEREGSVLEGKGGRREVRQGGFEGAGR